MSGRDLRHFVTSHRNDETDKLILRVKEGLPVSKYKEVDYEKLKAFAAEQKSKGHQKLVKVKKLQQISKQSKENNLLKQHQMVWKKEFNRLNSLKNHTQADVDEHVRQNAESDLLGQIYGDFESYEAKLEHDLVKFRDGTVTPVWNLREDLIIWVEECKLHGITAELEKPENVRETIDLVRNQQQKIMEKLHHEQKTLEEELKSGDLPTLSRLPPQKSIQTGIPEEAFDLECPDLELKASVLQEFILLDQKYVEKLSELEEQHQQATESPTGYWTEADHFVFLYIVDQYTHDIPNRRMLYIDRLKRHLPHMTRAHIVAHEEWWTMYKYYFERRKDLISDWTRDRTELLNRAKVVFSEALAAYRQEENNQENRQKQREFCNELYAKVREWREMKLEAMKLEQEYLEQRRQERLALLREEEEREKIKRQKEKERIQNFHEQQAAIRRKQEMENKARLEELKKQLEEQARYDNQRVKFREAELEKKREEQMKKLEEQEKARAEKEELLERIREKVRPHVDADLMRLWSDTEAWQARMKSEEEFINIQRPLFEINTFTTKKIVADPRFRLAEKLHEAGLNNNPYAQQVYSKLQPIHAPRRDMESTVFNYN